MVSFLNEDGQPEIVERAKILPPQCLMAAASDDGIKGVMDGQSDLMDKYGTAVDRESAFEIILGEVEKADEEKAEAEAKAEEKKPSKKLKKQKRLPKKHKKKLKRPQRKLLKPRQSNRTK